MALTDIQIDLIANKTQTGMSLADAKALVLGASAPVEDTVEKSTPEKKTATQQKKELSEKILELGGTPPDSGSVAVFQTLLTELESGEAGGLL